VKRGETWWAELSSPAGRRPVLLLSRDQAYRVRNAVTVTFLTRTIRNIPVEVPLGPSEGLPHVCVANLDMLNTIPKSLLRTRICTLSKDKMAAVDAATRFALGIR